MMAEVDFPALGLQPLTPPKKIPAGFKPPPSMPIEAVKGMIKGIEASFGTHQVLLQDYNPEDLQADFAEAKGVKVAATVHLECGVC